MSVVQLGELMATQTPGLNPAQFQEEEFELWSIPAFDAGAPERLLGSEIGSAKKVVQPGDVLLSRIVPHIRRSWVVSKSADGLRQIGSGEWMIFRSKRFDPNYLRHFLISDVFHPQFMQTVAGVGGSLLRARPEGVREISFYLPPLEEQKRIAAILDQADELRRKRQRALDRLNQLGQALFIEMFGDPVTNSMGWPAGTIRDLLAEAKYGTSAKANTDGVGLPMLRMGNLTYDGKIDLSDLKHVELSDDEFDKYTTRPGDILFNRTNSKELVGKTAVVTQEEPLAIAGYLVRARTNERGNPHYISAYLNSAHGKTTLRNMCKNIVGMANINAQEFQSITIALPPKEMQDNFAARVSGTEIARLPMTIARSKTESMFASLQARAFRGEL